MKAISIIFLLVFTGIPYGFADCITLSWTWTDAICNGDSSGTATVFVINGGIPPYSFDWSTGDTTPTATGLAAGIYMVTITDSTGTCTGDTAITINEPLPLTISLSSTAASCDTCCDACVTVANVTGGCLPYNLQWPQGNPTFPPCIACAGTTYTVIFTDSCGCTLIDSITPDTVPIVGIDGTRQQLQGGSVTVYPNPSNDYFTVMYSGDIGDGVEINLYDITGRRVKQIYSGKRIETGQPMKFSCKQFSSGLYFITLKTNDKQLTRKLVVNH